MLREGGVPVRDREGGGVAVRDRGGGGGCLPHQAELRRREGEEGIRKEPLCHAERVDAVLRRPGLSSLV